MSNSFNSDGDQTITPADSQSQGSFAEQGKVQDPSQSQDANGIQAQEDMVALQKRDEHAQQHISKLEDENKLFREKLDALEERVNAATDLDSVLTKDDLDKDSLVSETADRIMAQMDADKQKATKDSNFKQVSESLTQRYGDKVDDKVAEVAASNGMTFDEVVELSRTKPQLVMNLFGTQAPASAQPTQSSLRTQGFQQEAAPTKLTGLALYENLQSSDKNRIEHLERALKEYTQNN